MRFALKLLVAVILLGLIARNVDMAALLSVVAGARPGPLALALALGFAIAASDAAFWTTAMGALGWRLAYAPAFVFSLVGWFFSNLAPSSVGSDLFRAAQMRRAGASTEAVLRLVVAARLMSLVTLLGVIAVGLPFALRYAVAPLDRALLLAVFLLAVGALAAFLMTPLLLRRAPARLRLPVFVELAAVASDLSIISTGHRDAVLGWIFSALQHLLRVAVVAAVAWSLSAPVDVAALFALIPVSLLVAMIPVSLGSWGVREASFIYFLGLAGVPSAIALGISIAFGLIRLVIGLAGGVVWVVARAEHYRFEVTPRAQD
jgi:hypothetical protein